MSDIAHSRVGLIGASLHQSRLFFIALQFFTRLPAPRWVGFQPDWLRHATRYYPAVGIVVGVATGVVYALAAWLWPAAVAVLLSTAAGIYLTGALHEDGFADICDGMGGGSTPERILEIMKDSRVGAYGAIGIGLLLALKCVVLSAMPTQVVALTLLMAHPLSRVASTTLILRMKYVRADGKAKALAQQMSGLEFLIGSATGLLPAVLLGFAGAVAWHGIVAGAVTAALATAWLARRFLQRIGGYTGDCLGAVQQVAEIAFYLGALACMQNGAAA
jgi:adenosylcobinamide-GDP ribazoletransferase